MKRDEQVTLYILGALLVLYIARTFLTNDDAVGAQINPYRDQRLGAAGVDPYEMTRYTVEQMASGTGL